MEDLKQHVQYEGGYHARHKVIKNLWQVRFAIAQLSRLPLLGYRFSSEPTERFPRQRWICSLVAAKCRALSGD